MLLTGVEDTHRDTAAAVDRFLAYARGHALTLRRGLDARGRPVAAAALAGPGRAAVVLCSPLADADAAEAAAGTLRSLNGGLAGVRVAQALVETDRPHERAALRAAGYESLATLVYMGAEAEGPAGGAPAPLQIGGEALEEEPWSAGTAPRFAAAVEASYEDTLDCPGLVGRRPTDEVLEGHRAAGGPGAFAPGRWRVFSDARGPVAVLLLARLPHEPTLEVVYLGVAARARGRGLGRALLERARAEARRTGAGRVALAADAANRPALKLYRSAGFRTLQRRFALAHFLGPAPAPKDA